MAGEVMAGEEAIGDGTTLPVPQLQPCGLLGAREVLEVDSAIWAAPVRRMC